VHPIISPLPRPFFFPFHFSLSSLSPTPSHWKSSLTPLFPLVYPFHIFISFPSFSTFFFHSFHNSFPNFLETADDDLGFFLFLTRTEDVSILGFPHITAIVLLNA
jgi:hypothetical protein